MASSTLESMLLFQPHISVQVLSILIITNVKTCEKQPFSFKSHTAYLGSIIKIMPIIYCIKTHSIISYNLQYPPNHIIINK